LSLIVNFLLYAGSLWSFLDLARRLNVSERYLIALAFYPPFLFFSALVNKDIFLIFILLRLTIAFIEWRLASIIALSLLVGLVRFQYLALPLLAWFLLRGRFGKRFAVAYIATALAAAQITRSTDFFALEHFNTGGISDLVFALNRDYLIGSLLLNPIRVLQYPLSLAQGWTLVIADEGIDLMKVTEGVTFFWFLWVAPGVLRFFRATSRRRIDRASAVLRAMLTSFVLILLLTSITEPRYLMSLYPILLLCAAKARTMSVRRRRTRIFEPSVAFGVPGGALAMEPR
jgi:hypothetical protein